jgi:hypothetical protein
MYLSYKERASLEVKSIPGFVHSHRNVSGELIKWGNIEIREHRELEGKIM